MQVLPCNYLNIVLHNYISRKLQLIIKAISNVGVFITPNVIYTKYSKNAALFQVVASPGLILRDVR